MSKFFPRKENYEAYLNSNNVDAVGKTKEEFLEEYLPKEHLNAITCTFFEELYKYLKNEDCIL